jgi:hypothetical protein
MVGKHRDTFAVSASIMGAPIPLVDSRRARSTISKMSAGIDRLYSPKRKAECLEKFGFGNMPREKHVAKFLIAKKTMDKSNV